MFKNDTSHTFRTTSNFQLFHQVDIFSPDTICPHLGTKIVQHRPRAELHGAMREKLLNNFN
jgi:hypothetical protein